jgi:hypothetical protein
MPGSGTRARDESPRIPGKEPGCASRRSQLSGLAGIWAAARQPARSDRRPVPIIADEPVAARWFQAASPATVQVWVVPHAGHTQGLATAPRTREARVISFLNAALQPARQLLTAQLR